MLTDVRGIFSDPADEETFIPRMKLQAANRLIKNGAIGGGMIPKLDSVIHALRRGVPRAHILDGRLKHSILLELLSEKCVGTMITRE